MWVDEEIRHDQMARIGGRVWHRLAPSTQAHVSYSHYKLPQMTISISFITSDVTAQP